MEYLQRRDLIYEPLKVKGTFTWDWMYGREYALASIYTITKELRQEVALATEALGQIFFKTVDVVRKGKNELLLELGIPQAALEAVRVSVLENTPTLIGRFDFAVTPHGLKMLEFNSDTPGGIVEGFYVNGKVCEFYGLHDPNEGMAGQLGHAFKDIVAKYKGLGYKTENIFFSALDWHEEDAGTTKYLMDNSGLNANFVPLKDLRVYNDNVYALINNKLVPVNVLYRLHPLGTMAEEQDDDGYPTGAHLLDIIARRKLAVINPPETLIAQTKALQALIWSLCEANDFFTNCERQIIKKYMLPTYLENRFLGQCPYVVKPIFGREGGAVTLYNRDGSIVAKNLEHYYWEQEMVYQSLVELSKVSAATMEGVYEGRLLLSSFLVEGHAAALIGRLGGMITDDMSYFLPIGMEDQ